MGEGKSTDFSRLVPASGKPPSVFCNFRSGRVPLRRANSLRCQLNFLSVHMEHRTLCFSRVTVGKTTFTRNFTPLSTHGELSGWWSAEGHCFSCTLHLFFACGQSPSESSARLVFTTFNTLHRVHGVFCRVFFLPAFNLKPSFPPSYLQPTLEPWGLRQKPKPQTSNLCPDQSCHHTVVLADSVPVAFRLRGRPTRTRTI